MKKINSVALLGGGGRTGRYIVTQLLDLGYHLKLLLRNPENFQLHDPHIEIVPGNAADPDAIRSVTQGCQAIISTIGQRQNEPPIHAIASLNVLQAMAEFGINRYILLAGLNVDTPLDKKGLQTEAATKYMKANFPGIHEDRQKTYALLSSSNSQWTLVRVPFIIFTELRREIVVNTEDCPGTEVHAADIAAFIASQLTDGTYIFKCPFIANK